MISIGMTYPVIELCNETSSSFTNVTVTLSTPFWSTTFKKLKKNATKSRGIIKYSYLDTTNITVSFTDENGNNHKFIPFENYIIKGKPTLKIIFHNSSDKNTFLVETITS